jgi:hypothetical protein
MKRWLGIQNKLFEPVSIAFLVYVRLFAGGFFAGELINQFFTGDYLTYLNPHFHFTYQFFPFLTGFPAPVMYGLFAVIIGSSLLVMVGLFYRLAAVLLFLSSTLLFLSDKAEYVNHAYLYCIIAFFLIWMPANAAFSLDVKRKPQLAKSKVPNWMYLLLLFQMGVVYFYAGIAKIHADWFQALALKQWIGPSDTYPLFGALVSSAYTPWILSYGGLLFDLLIVPALLWKRSRRIAFIVACTFHLSNVMVFGLATFPWFSIMMTALFFGPAWPEKLPILRNYLNSTSNAAINYTKQRSLITTLLFTYVVVQLLLPFRHFLYPGSPNWSEEGHRFSWHMMLRSKTGHTSFKINADGQLFYEEGTPYLNATQLRKMNGDPDMILEFAHFLYQLYRDKGYNDVQVYANSMVSLNGRPMQVLIDPTVNLATEKRSLCHYNWILPLE